MTNTLQIILQIVGAVAVAANALTLLVPKTSALSPWLAWLAAAPVKHSPNGALPRLLARVAGRAAPPVALAFVLALALPANGCTPARYPAIQDVATATVNVTDLALAAYIRSEPARPPVDLETLVGAIDRAAVTVQSKGDPCTIVDDVAFVATAIACKDCLDLARGVADLAGCDR